MYSVHGTIYPFTQGSHSDSADCSSNVFMAEASRPFESCVSLVFVLTRCFRLFLTCATLPFLQIWLVVVTRVGKAEVGWTRSGDSAAWLWRMKSSEGCCGRMGDEGRLCGIETVPHLCMAVFSAWLNWPSCVIYSFSHLPLWFSGDFKVPPELWVLSVILKKTFRPTVLHFNVTLTIWLPLCSSSSAAQLQRVHLSSSACGPRCTHARGVSRSWASLVHCFWAMRSVSSIHSWPWKRKRRRTFSCIHAWVIQTDERVVRRYIVEIWRVWGIWGFQPQSRVKSISLWPGLKTNPLY